MIQKLVQPFDFDGKRFTEIRLSDYVKAKHTLAYAKVGKLASQLKKSGLSENPDFDELSEDEMVRFLEFEVQSQKILHEAFSEGFPPDALGELSAIDCGNISLHIKNVMDEHSRISGQSDDVRPSGKKKIHPIRPAR